jgi:3',5'-cyclic-AMP phosphodiesterase
MNFLQAQQRAKFWSLVAKEGPDAVLVGGDIGEAFNFADYLGELATQVDCPVCFVLGNHDFYHGSLARVRAKTATIAEKAPNLCWLTKAGVVGLTETTGLIGHEGWADGRLGNYAASTVMLNDYALIEELSGLTKDHRLEILNRLGDEAAAHVEKVLPEALGDSKG